MHNYNPIYRKFIDDRNPIAPLKMLRGNFYIIKEYIYNDGVRERYNEIDSPIIYTLFVSIPKDVVHCVKITNIPPAISKKLFGKFLNEETDELEMRGGAKKIYETIVSKIPAVTTDAYRTYNLSGIKKVFKLDMEVENLIPKRKKK